jgi:hypothetical protein
MPASTISQGARTPGFTRTTRVSSTPALPDDQPAGLEQQAGVPTCRHPPHHLAIDGGAGRLGLAGPVRHAKAAAKVGAADVTALGPERRDQLA